MTEAVALGAAFFGACVLGCAYVLRLVVRDVIAAVHAYRAAHERAEDVAAVASRVALVEGLGGAHGTRLAKLEERVEVLYQRENMKALSRGGMG